MVLLQQFKDGYKCYDDIGNAFQLADWETSREEFNKAALVCFGDPGHMFIKDVYGFVLYGNGSKVEPLYKGRYYYIYSNDGQLFKDISLKIPQG